MNDMAMGSPLDSTLANIFICSFENNWLNDLSNGFKSVFYK